MNTTICIIVVSVNVLVMLVQSMFIHDYSEKTKELDRNKEYYGNQIKSLEQDRKSTKERESAFYEILEIMKHAFPALAKVAKK